mmetsp:Transcript_53012/g.93113  ORF Transcript_53012/g.93113 Transcript_53012/m.93113 type:complete len:376 (-) Transcript_53012:153-1280(-)
MADKADLVPAKARRTRVSLKQRDMAEQMKRRAAAQERRMDVVEVIEEKESVLTDHEGLKAAALKASHGGKKRIVGLYLPSGNRMDIKSEELQAEAEKKEKEEEKLSAQARMRRLLPGASAKGDPHKEKDKAMTERVSYNRVVQTYQHGRTIRKAKCDRDRVSEDILDDEEQTRKVQGFVDSVAEHDMMQFNDLFKFFDVDGDRNWGSIEFAQRMTDIGFSTNVEDAANLLYFAGVRDVDRITYNDYMEMMPKLRAYRRMIEKDAMHHFSKYDEGSGYITRQALKKVVHSIVGPDGMHHHDVDALVKKSDREKTGFIPFDFFIIALFGSKPLVKYKREIHRKPILDRIFGSMRCCGALPHDGKGHFHHEEEEEDKL